jgi:N-methylhydantoinase A
MSDLRRDLFVTRIARFQPESADAIGRAVAEIDQAALAQFTDDGMSADSVSRVSYVKLRYENQEHSVEVALAPGPVDADAIEATIASFHDNYEREYTYRLTAPVELVGLHVVATGTVGKLQPAERPVTGRRLEDAIKGSRTVDYAPDGVHEGTIFDGGLLEPGMHAGGPAIIETAGTTIVVRPSDVFDIDRFGNVHLTVEPRIRGTR